MLLWSDVWWFYTKIVVGGHNLELVIRELF